MAIIESPGFSHVRLTVSNIDRSKEFYDRMLGWPAVIDMSAHVDEPGVTSSPDQFYGGVLYRSPSGVLFGLRPVATPGQRFDSEHVGLDHVSFRVESRDELTVVRDRLEQAGVEHGEVRDLTDSGIAILSFSDPDGIHLELSASLSS